MRTIFRFGMFVGLAVTCIHLGSARAQMNYGWQDNNSLQPGRLTRYFRAYVPKNLPPNAPVTILFHGGTQSMHKVFDRNAGGSQRWQELAEREKFLLLVPNGTDPATGDTQGDRQNWHDCRRDGTNANNRADDVAFTRSLIDWAATNYQTDKQRVYATGASNGGQMVYRLAIEMSDRLAAGAVFIANLPADSECQTATRPVPLKIVNGTADPLMPWDGGQIAGDRGKVISARETLNYWLRINRSMIKDAKLTRLPDLDRGDNSTIFETVYPASANGAAVVFDRVEGGGHAMPSVRYPLPRFIQRRLVGAQNRDLEGADAAWEFLKQHRR